MSRINPQPQFRIRVAETPTSTFVDLPMQGHRQNGFRIISFPIGCAFNQQPQAVISRDYGRISGRQYDGPTNLDRYYLVIDFNTGSPDDPLWRTDFAGIVLGQRDSAVPGSGIKEGVVNYYVAHISHYLRWMKLNQHLWYLGSLASSLSKGHPSYNATDDVSLVIGNKSTSYDLGDGDAAFAPIGSADSAK